MLPIPTYQLDRGRFENHLADVCRADGVRLLDGVTVRDLNLAQGAHKVALRSGQGESAYRARYLVDASGRRAWLRKGEDLSRPARHNNSAIWFRVDGALDVDSWSSDRQWQARCHGSSRRLSTNHFTAVSYTHLTLPTICSV